jgi:hypothetical protein
MALFGCKINKTTKDVVEWGNYPREDGGAVTVPEPYEWFIVRYGDRLNVFDQFLFKEAIINPDKEDIDNWAVHPDYAGGRQYYITYDYLKRTETEVAQSIKSVEAERNYTIVPPDVISKMLPI